MSEIGDSNAKAQAGLGYRRTPWYANTMLWFALALSTLQAILFARLWVGDFFNSYPYISADGFDWITEGVALRQLLAGVDASQWPILRQPVFVILASIDDLMGAGGIVLVVAQTAATFGTALMLGNYAREQGLRSPIALLVVAAWFFSVLGFFRLWVLSDTIASFLMTASSTSLLRVVSLPRDIPFQKRLKSVLPAAALALGAGLTQTYGLIAFFVIMFVYTLLEIFGEWRRPVIMFNILVTIAVALIWLLLKTSWASMISHGMEPSQFDLLKLNFDMADFYLSVWPLAFGPLAISLLFIAFARMRTGPLATAETLALGAVVLCFAVLTFIYQWEDARFTFVYLPIVWLLGISWASSGCAAEGDTPSRSQGLHAALGAGAAVTVMVGLLIAPQNYWQPNLAHTHFAPRSTWVAAAIQASPVDRMSLQARCTGMHDVCDKARIPPSMGSYEQMMFGEYIRRRNLE